MDMGKRLSDMKDMLAAAPGLIESANELAANAQANQAAYLKTSTPAAPVAAPQPGNLDPIAGVDLALYATVAKGLAQFGYDQSKAAGIAALHGVDAASWKSASDGWGARIQSDPAVASQFNHLYTGN
jgi:hypothetical protein